MDAATRFLEPVRSAIGTLVSPLQVMAEVPYLLADEVGEVASTHEALRQRNAELERRILELSQISQQFLSLKTENERLRELLGSRARLPAEVLVAELVGVVPIPNTHQVIIDGTRAMLEAGDFTMLKGAANAAEGQSWGGAPRP